MEFVFFLAAFGRSDTFQFSTREVIIRLQTNNIRGQVVGIFSITIHTNVYKIPPDEPKQAEADHDAIANNAYHSQMFGSKTIAASQCISNGGNTR